MQEILDLGARIGVAALVDKIDRTQIENIFSSLDFVEDKKLALLVTAIFAERQVARLKKEEEHKKRYQGKRYHTARLINEAMIKLFDNNFEKDHARQLFNIAKWVYEAMGQRERELEELQRRLEKLTFDEISRLTLRKVLDTLRER
ncbi:MAG: hypothetical protein QW794_03060 [Thermosphaera sp.]